MLSSCPSFKAAPRMRHNAFASLSALASESIAFPAGAWESFGLNTLATESFSVPNAKLAPRPAKPATLPSWLEGTRRCRNFLRAVASLRTGGAVSAACCATLSALAAPPAERATWAAARASTGECSTSSGEATVPGGGFATPAASASLAADGEGDVAEPIEAVAEWSREAAPSLVKVEAVGAPSVCSGRVVALGGVGTADSVM
mmetsp:Transcript_6250/g.17939  ORF Transcript_6250/g.17939 Transcript_6250/m.17939 type:complete len:203 (-) Transcript_6250:991-1599(-)